MSWAEELLAFCDEAAGLVEVNLVGGEHLPGLQADAEAGDTEALVVLAAVNDMVARIAGAPPWRPLCCLSCGDRLRRGHFCAGVVLPVRPDPVRGLGLAVCDRCAPVTEGAMPAVMEALRQVWPDLRSVQLGLHDAGHA